MFGWGKAIDKKTFLETVGGDPALIDTLIELFRKQSQENVQALEAAARKGDSKAFQQAVHDLKNIGRNIASRKLLKHSARLEALGTRLEAAGASAQLEEATKSVQKTTEILAQALEELQAMRQSMP